MPDDNCDTDQPQTLSNARNLKWREKLLAINRIARTTKPTEKLELDTNIADFLGNSAQSARKASITGSGHESDSSSTATNIVGGPSDKNALITQTLHLPYARQITSRRRRREGPPLQVRFTDAEPELIGEGGDEALLPSAEVTKSWLVLAKTSQSSEVKTLWDSKYSNSDGRNLEDPVYQSSVGVQSGSANNGALKQSIASSCQNTSQQCRASWSSGASHEAHQRLPTPPPSGLEVSSRHKDDELWISRVRPKVEPDIEANLDTPSHRLPADTYATTPRRPSPSTQPDPSAEKIRNRHPSPLQSANTTGASRTSYTELISPYPSDLRELSSKLENGSRPENALEEVITGEGVDDFHSRVQHLRSIFRLATDASRHTPAGFSEWLTIAKWWFLRGRIAIEKVTHAIGQNFQALQEIQNGNIPLPLKQAFVDLAKAWWIAKEVMPELNQSVSSDGGRLAASEISLPEDYHGLLASMRALSKSMVKGHILPPTMFLAQGVDTMVWIHYTDLAPNLAYLLSGTASKKVLQQHNPGEVETDLIIPLSDTEQHFIYGRMFVDIEVVSNNESPVGRLPCLISILRRRTSYDVEIILASQDSRIRLHVQSEKRKGPTWSDVQWKRKSSCILIHLAPEMDIMVRMGEHDFRNLWGIYDYANRLTSNWEAQKDENLTFDHVSRLFHKVNSSHPESEFPTRPLRHCRIRLFCKRTAAPDGTGSQVSHDENRLVIMTPPSNRTLSSINQPLGLNTPLFFDYLRGEDDAPALSLYLSGVNKGTKPTMIVTFDQASTRAKLHSQLDGSFVSSYETASREILIRGFMTSSLTPVRPPHQDILKFPEGIEWQHVRVIRPEADKKDESFLSDRVRVCVHSSYGNVTDRICLGNIYSIGII